MSSVAPVRIQLRRTKGWKMPPNTVSVARPGRWGNPHYVSPWRDAQTCVALFRDSAEGIWNPSTSVHLPDAWHRGSYEAHHAWLGRLGAHPSELIPYELRGKNLACWCKIGDPCHADVLLELANPTTSRIADDGAERATPGNSGRPKNIPPQDQGEGT